MKTLLKIVSYIGLGMTIIPSILVFSGVIETKTSFIIMGIGMFVYFGSAPFWMKSKSLEEEGA